MCVVDNTGVGVVDVYTGCAEECEAVVEVATGEYVYAGCV